MKSGNQKSNVETVRYYALLCLTVACYLGAGAVFISIFINIPSHADWALEITTFAFVFGYLVTVESLKDCFVVLVFYELGSDFRQVREIFRVLFWLFRSENLWSQVREQMLLDINAGNSSEKRLDAWRGLILSIRKQTEMASDYMSYPQLSLLLQSILLGTVAIFIVLAGAFGSMAGIWEYCLSTFLWLLVRLFCKAWFAEQITAEVRRQTRKLLTDLEIVLIKCFT